MTDRGEFIEVEVGEMEPQFLALLRAVEEDGRTVRVFRAGKEVAQIAPPAGDSTLPIFPELAGVIFNADPAAPLDEEDWPDSSR